MIENFTEDMAKLDYLLDMYSIDYIAEYIYMNDEDKAIKLMEHIQWFDMDKHYKEALVQLEIEL